MDIDCLNREFDLINDQIQKEFDHANKIAPDASIGGVIVAHFKFTAFTQQHRLTIRRNQLVKMFENIENSK